MRKQFYCINQSYLATVFTMPPATTQKKKSILYY